MRSVLVPVSLALSVFLARADVLTLGPSSQEVMLTGIGIDSSGSGNSKVDWGDCVFQSNHTVCTVSGRYTGLGGGVYGFILDYPGNGPSPLTAVTSPPTSDFFSASLSSGSLVFTIQPDSGAPSTFYNLAGGIAYNPMTSRCTGTSQCGVGAVGRTPGATITGPVTGQFDTTPVITPSGGLVTATAYGAFPSIAPATWVEIYGTNLGTTRGQVWGGSDFQGAQAPSALAGTTVTIGGKPAFVQYVSPNQVNAQVPSGLAAGSQRAIVKTAGGTSVAFNVNVEAVKPGVLSPPVFNIGGTQYVVAQFPDNSFVLPPGSVPGATTRRAKPGDVLVIYGIGFGPVNPNIDAGLIEQQANSLSGFQASIGGQSATVQFAGLVNGFVGLYQFNVVVPNIPASDKAPFTFSVGGVAGSQMLYLPIGN